MQAFCDDARATGAQVVAGGAPHRASGMDAGGYWWQPTVIARPAPDCRAMREEPFGPLALVSPFANLDEAIAAANASDYGLSAYAFTGALHAEQRLRRELRAGSVAINTCAMAPPELPFSGIKDSGMGYEMGTEGLREHFHVKSILRLTS